MKTKLVFFDMEGVILKKRYDKNRMMRSVWAVIANKLGEKSREADKKCFDKWKNKKYASYIEWAEDILKSYVKFGLTKDVFYKIIKESEYTNGVEEVFGLLREKGIKTVIISGGFKEHVDIIAKKLNVSHSASSCELRWKNNKLDSWNILPFDEEGKAVVMGLFMKNYSLNKEECAFIGDGRNDVNAARAVGTSIAFNAEQELKKASKFVIKQEKDKEDLREVLKYL